MQWNAGLSGSVLLQDWEEGRGLPICRRGKFIRGILHKTPFAQLFCHKTAIFEEKVLVF